ncbi:unnamed protein product [Rotaria sordida]|uniref:Uncharacterized protein n=1 Tax=Rotaria sordida TaxID=392033 RepID=A0A815BDI7_9BILA|nr:unnamed protein product [Rotaria sordida]
MEQFIERLDTLLDNDPFSDVDWKSLSHNDCELLEKYRLRHLEERKRIREERKTKSFPEIMEDLLQALSNKPDISSFYRTLDDPLLTTNSINKDVHTIELDTSDDEQDDLEHCTTWIDPSKSIGRSATSDELKTSTYVVYPLIKSPGVPETSRKIHRYTDQSRRNTYTLQNSSSDDNGNNNNNNNNNEKQLMNAKQEYVHLNSQGFDPQQQENLFNSIKDARSTFSVSQKCFRFTHQEAQNILYKKLGAFIKGHLTRQLFRTEHVKRLIQTLNDTRKFAVDFQTQCLETKTKLDLDDINIIDQLIKQVESILDEIHAIFGRYSSTRQISMIIRHEQSQKMRTIRTNQQIAKDFSLERPIIDPLPTSTVKNDNLQQQSEYRRPQNIRRHVTAVPNRSAQSTIKTQARPLKKATSLQRKSRPLNSNNNESTSNRPRSSSTITTTNNNNNIFRPPLRHAPASPLFRNRLK